jgi:TctA family transporter
MIVTLFFAVFGLILVYLEINRIPYLIAFVLGGILERQYHLARRFSGGDVGLALFGSSLDQILIALFALSIILLVIPREKLVGRFIG